MGLCLLHTADPVINGPLHPLRCTASEQLTDVINDTAWNKTTSVRLPWANSSLVRSLRTSKDKSVLCHLERAMLLVREIAFRDADFMLGVGCMYRLMNGVDPRDGNEAHLRQETKSRYRAIWDQALRHGTTAALFDELSDSMVPVPQYAAYGRIPVISVQRDEDPFEREVDNEALRWANILHHSAERARRPDPVALHRAESTVYVTHPHKAKPLLWPSALGPYLPPPAFGPPLPPGFIRVELRRRMDPAVLLVEINVRRRSMAEDKLRLAWSDVAMSVRVFHRRLQRKRDLAIPRRCPTCWGRCPTCPKLTAAPASETELTIKLEAPPPWPPEPASPPWTAPDRDRDEGSSDNGKTFRRSATRGPPEPRHMALHRRPDVSCYTRWFPPDGMLRYRRDHNTRLVSAALHTRGRAAGRT